MAKERKEPSVADEVALQCADEFLCRLERALKRKYQNEVEDDLMFWDDELIRKRPRIEAANDHDGVGSVDHAPFFGADTNADAASIPCPASAMRTESSEPEVSPSVRKLSGIFHNQMINKPHPQNLPPGLSWASTVQEPRHSAMELWQAGIEFKAAETSEDDG